MATASALYRPADDVAPIDIDERVPLLFDYTEMAEGDTFSGVPVVTCEAISGTDASASTRPDGAPELTALQAVQWMQGCVEGVQYLIRCKATMTSGQVLVQAISLRCLKVGASDA
jgi:hypothetical protein